jgi:hypothetical protein
VVFKKYLNDSFAYRIEDIKIVNPRMTVLIAIVDPRMKTTEKEASSDIIQYIVLVNALRTGNHVCKKFAAT